MIDPAWRRWLLLAMLLLIGSGYIAAFWLFLHNSRDFFVVGQNRRAGAFSSARPVALPAILLVGQDQSDNDRLGGGWHHPDPGGVWSGADDAWIDIALLKQDQDVAVRLNTDAFVAPGHSRIKIVADVNGTRLGTWTREASNHAEPLEMRVPHNLVKTGQIGIHLNIRHSASPFEVRVGPDQRRLGILLSSVELSALSESAVE
jgi:hypothetical protein